MLRPLLEALLRDVTAGPPLLAAAASRCGAELRALLMPRIFAGYLPEPAAAQAAQWAEGVPGVPDPLTPPERPPVGGLLAAALAGAARREGP